MNGSHEKPLPWTSWIPLFCVVATAFTTLEVLFTRFFS